MVRAAPSGRRPREVALLGVALVQSTAPPTHSAVVESRRPNLTTLAEGLKQPDGLACDPDNRKLYWTENGKLCQANADGTRTETLVSQKTGQYASILVLPPKEP